MATLDPTNSMLLIDADILLYRCGFAAEKAKYLVEFNDGRQVPEHYDSAKEAKAAADGEEDAVIWTRRVVEPVENALQNIDTTITAITKENSEANQMRLYLTGKGNFRDTVATTKPYKDNRDPAHRPKHYRAIKEHLITKWKANIVHGQEADDAIGQDAYGMGMDKYVVVSNDKDLDQIAGFHYNWVTKQKYFVTEEDALKYFFIQMMTGDATDNIPGIVSEKAARELIMPQGSPHDCAVVVKEAYEKKLGDLWADRLEEIADLVWIRRGNDNGDKNPFWEHYQREAL